MKRLLTVATMFLSLSATAAAGTTNTTANSPTATISGGSVVSGGGSYCVGIDISSSSSSSDSNASLPDRVYYNPLSNEYLAYSPYSSGKPRIFSTRRAAEEYASFGRTDGAGRDLYYACFQHNGGSAKTCPVIDYTRHLWFYNQDEMASYKPDSSVNVSVPVPQKQICGNHLLEIQNGNITRIDAIKLSSTGSYTKSFTLAPNDSRVLSIFLAFAPEKTVIVDKVELRRAVDGQLIVGPYYLNVSPGQSQSFTFFVPEGFPGRFYLTSRNTNTNGYDANFYVPSYGGGYCNPTSRKEETVFVLDHSTMVKPYLGETAFYYHYRSPSGAEGYTKTLPKGSLVYYAMNLVSSGSSYLVPFDYVETHSLKGGTLKKATYSCYRAYRYNCYPFLDCTRVSSTDKTISKPDSYFEEIKKRNLTYMKISPYSSYSLKVAPYNITISFSSSYDLNTGRFSIQKTLKVNGVTVAQKSVDTSNSSTSQALSLLKSLYDTVKLACLAMGKDETTCSNLNLVFTSDGYVVAVDKSGETVSTVKNPLQDTDAVFDEIKSVFSF